jgi:hypothetical protein
MSSFRNGFYLGGHYRSRDESLISFSNHYLYQDRLVTFPGPGGRDVNVTCRPLQDLILPHNTAVYYLRNSLYVIHLASLLVLTPRTQNPPTFGSWGFDSPSRHHRFLFVLKDLRVSTVYPKGLFPVENSPTAVKLQ